MGLPKQKVMKPVGQQFLLMAIILNIIFLLMLFINGCRTELVLLTTCLQNFYNSSVVCMSISL